MVGKRRQLSELPESKHWNYSLNGNVRPEDVSISSTEKYMFDCPHCLHTFPTSACQVRVGQWCPYCTNRFFCDNLDCRVCLAKSFEATIWGDYLHPTLNGDLVARRVFKGSSQRVWIICPDCGHNRSHKANVFDRQGCKYCTNQALCDDRQKDFEEECDDCLAKSFKSHYRSEFLDYEKNYEEYGEDFDPRMLFQGTAQKIWFLCDELHSFKTSPNNLTSPNRNRWCPQCFNKTEAKLLAWFEDHDFEVEYQPTFDWCRSLTTNFYYPLDFHLPHLKCIVENDGQQHYLRNKKFFKAAMTLSEIQARDRYKEQCCLENGFSVIRIKQVDVWDDRNHWAEALYGQLMEIQEVPDQPPQVYWLYDPNVQE